ncbi:helix-turn-helix domain-containing protein [Metabacillus rhizolycopersici]|uniref:Helix-turn-helix domain-containing protein n=1 Tax=Metabacillus rhizolycopersici TaxID=2875709 RepID=A0ABS7UX54_9BACI|nr:helix-turn-helix domain-containing protein [Metabacillus rhizolycopersici]
MNITRNYLSKIENNKTPCSIERLYEIAEILDIEPYRFLTDVTIEDKDWLTSSPKTYSS